MQDPAATAATFAAIGAPPFGYEEQQRFKCPRCSSTNTKFCYYNNYNLSQPRHFCRDCRRYWTRGGALRNVPVGGGTRKSSKRGASAAASSSSSTSPSKRPTNHPSSPSPAAYPAVGGDSRGDVAAPPTQPPAVAAKFPRLQGDPICWHGGPDLSIYMPGSSFEWRKNEPRN